MEKNSKPLWFTIAVLALVIACLVGCFSGSVIGVAIQPGKVIARIANWMNVPCVPTPEPPAADPPAEPIVVPPPPVATATPTPPPSAAPTPIPDLPAAASAPGAPATDTETFNYVPGGESFGKVAPDVANPPGRSGCLRVWQATNLVDLPWTAVFCNWQTTDPAPQMQWPHPTEMVIQGTGTVSFELWRDLYSSAHWKELGLAGDPYQMSNVGNSSLGLGWYISGFNAKVCVNGVCVTPGTGSLQLAFPGDMTGFYQIDITVDSGRVQFWQGERITKPNNWDLPSSMARPELDLEPDEAIFRN